MAQAISVTERTDTQAAAIDKAAQIAKKQHSEVVIHRYIVETPNRDKNSYGNDPFPPGG